MTSETRPAYAGIRPPKLADHSPGFLAGIGHHLGLDVPIDAAGVELWAREQAR